MEKSVGKSMENEENERRSEYEKQRIQEDGMRKKMLNENWRKEFEQKMETEKREKLREWEEETMKENDTKRKQLEKDVEERVGAED